MLPLNVFRKKDATVVQSESVFFLTRFCTVVSYLICHISPDLGHIMVQQDANDIQY